MSGQLREPSRSNAEQGSRRSSAAATTVAVFLVSFVVFNANLRRIGTYDSMAAALIPFNLWEGHGLTLDREASLFPPPFQVALLRSKTGHLVSFYPVVTPILATPLYLPWAIARWAGLGSDTASLAPVLEKWSASLLAAVGVVLVFLVLDRLTSRTHALLLSAAYALGTSTWTIGSQALWQHGTSELLLALALLLLCAPKLGGPDLALLGLTAGLLTANRPSNIAFSAAIAYIVLRQYRTRAIPFFLSSAVVSAAWIIYNRTHFDSILGGYGDFRLRDGRPFWMASNGIEGFFGLLVSNRGLLIYSPFLLLLFRSPRAAWEKLGAMRPLLLAILLALYLSARTADWAGGYCYGPRFATDGLPILVVALAGPLERLRSPAGKGIFALALLFSVATQAVGVFCFPGGDSGNEVRGLWNVANFSPRLALGAGLQTPDFAALLWPRLCLREPLPPAGRHATYRWVEPLPQPWRARETKRIEIEIQNEGEVRWTSLGDWNGTGAVRLVGSWEGQPEGPPYSLAVGNWWAGFSIPPKGSARRHVLVTAPNVSGTFRLCLQLAQVGYGLFSENGAAPLCTDLSIAEGERRPGRLLAVEWAGGFGPGAIPSGAEAFYRVRVRNLSDRPWPASVAVSYHWTQFDGNNSHYEGVRTPLPPDESGQASAWVIARVAANVPPGVYCLQFDLVEEHRAWASNSGSPGMLLLVRVLPPDRR